ncbi:MAG: BREX-3 system P-loop-containing protein BrxF [Bacillota bacterium]
MTETLCEQIIARIGQTIGLYHRLVLTVAPSGSGKTRALQEVARRRNGPLINVNLELGRRLLDLTHWHRSLHVAQLLGDIVEGLEHQVVLLDNPEILFDASLRQDPLRLLQALSRNRTAVAAWNGTLENGHLVYVVPDHPEYRRYPALDLVIASPMADL